MNANTTQLQPNHAARMPSESELSARLNAVQESLRELGSDDSLMQIVGGVSQAVKRMTTEHGGMVEELLSLYEQLGVVFEVSRSLGSVKNEHDVLELFIGSLGRSFAGRMVTVTQANAQGLLAPQEDLDDDDGWLTDLVRRSVQHRRVMVETAAEETIGTVAEAMAGPVIAGNSVVCTLVLTRPVEGQAFRASDMLLLESLSLFCGDLIRNHRLVREMQTMSVTMVRALVSAVDQKDTYTSGHSIRVGFFATLLGRTKGLNKQDMKMLEWSALLHDVGKIGIRDDVLKKPGKLTKEEFDHIKEHPLRSYEVVKEIPHLADALDGVLYHHERMDGTGYPEGLTGEDIPLQARIVQIADIFDALTSSRAYRPAFEWGPALDVLSDGSGTTSDADLLKLFDPAIRDAIGDAPDGWARLIEQAERFSETATLLPSDKQEV